MYPVVLPHANGYIFLETFFLAVMQLLKHGSALTIEIFLIECCIYEVISVILTIINTCHP